MAPQNGNIAAGIDDNSPLLLGIHDETCEALKIARETRDIVRGLRAELDRFKPLIDAYAASGGGVMGLARLGKAGRRLGT